MPKAQTAGQGNRLVEQKKRHTGSPGIGPVPPARTWTGLASPICQTKHKDSCPLPNASVYLPTLSPSCLLPRQSVTTTSARKAQEAHWAHSPACLTLPQARPETRPHTGKCGQMDMQALRHGTRHTSMQAQIYSPTFTLIYAPYTRHTETCHTVYMLQHTGHIPTHTQVASHDACTLPKNMPRSACLSCDSQMVGFSHWATI